MRIRSSLLTKHIEIFKKCSTSFQYLFIKYNLLVIFINVWYRRSETLQWVSQSVRVDVKPSYNTQCICYVGITVYFPLARKFRARIQEHKNKVEVSIALSCKWYSLYILHLYMKVLYVELHNTFLSQHFQQSNNVAERRVLKYFPEIVLNLLPLTVRYSLWLYLNIMYNFIVFE